MKSTTAYLLLALVVSGCASVTRTAKVESAEEHGNLSTEWQERPQLEPHERDYLSRYLLTMHEPVALTNGVQEYCSAYRLLFAPAMGLEHVCVRVDRLRQQAVLTVKVATPDGSYDGSPGRLVYSCQRLLNEKDFKAFESRIGWLKGAPPQPLLAGAALDAPSCIFEVADGPNGYSVVRRTDPGIETSRWMKEKAADIRKYDPGFDAEWEIEVQKAFVKLLGWCAEKTDLFILKNYVRQAQ